MKQNLQSHWIYLGEWDVALIYILFPHNWTNLDKSYQYFLLRQPTEGVDSEFTPETEKD